MRDGFEELRNNKMSQQNKSRASEEDALDQSEMSRSSSLRNPLMKAEKAPAGCWQSMKHWMFQTVQTDQRAISNNGRVSPKNHISNRIDNSKYSLLTFIPMVFYHQFKHFLNLYFLLIALTQFYDLLRVGALIRLPHYLHLADRDHPHRFLH